MSAPQSPPIDHAKLAEALWPTVAAAARLQLSYFRAGTAVLTKSDASPVTAADHESEALILSALATIAPDIPVVAEEAAAAGRLPDLHRHGQFFLVDPLDGTREFISDRPEFTINIALIADGVPRFGLIYAPALGVLYATLNDASAIEARVNDIAAPGRFNDLVSSRITSRAPPVDGLVAIGSRTHGTSGTDAFLGQYKVKRRTSAGSSLKFGLVAKGDADIYPRLGPTCEWDTAAGHAILLAAGGSVTTLDGTPLRYGNAAGKYINPDFVAWGRQPLPPQY